MPSFLVQHLLAHSLKVVFVLAAKTFLWPDSPNSSERNLNENNGVSFVGGVCGFTFPAHKQISKRDALLMNREPENQNKLPSGVWVIVAVIFIVVPVGLFKGTQWLFVKKAPTETSEQSRDKSIVVKGMRIGMTFDELSLAVDRLGPPWKISHSDEDTFAKSHPREITIKSGLNWLIVGGNTDIEIKLDDSDRVISIWIGKEVSLKLFGSDNMTGHQFIETFKQSYGIPEMQYGPEYSWYRRGDVEVRISMEKEVYILRIDPSKVKKRFD